jgi:hypothetical protein
MDTRYETDFYLWALTQAELAQTRSSNKFDWDNVAEELRLLSVSEERELTARLRVLFCHLLKWMFQPERQSRSWSLTIANQRDELARHLAKNPGLKSKLSLEAEHAYTLARRDAAIETDVDLETYPIAMPFTVDEGLNHEFWPVPVQPTELKQH